MSGNTNGPLRNDGVVIKSDSAIVAQALQESDARRIVACWNACAGISTEQLKEWAEMGRPIRKSLADLKAEADSAARMRDTLLVAAHTAADQIRRCDYTPARSTLLQAIASVEGNR